MIIDVLLYDCSEVGNPRSTNCGDLSFFYINSIKEEGERGNDESVGLFCRVVSAFVYPSCACGTSCKVKEVYSESEEEE